MPGQCAGVLIRREKARSAFVQMGLSLLPTGDHSTYYSWMLQRSNLLFYEESRTTSKLEIDLVLLCLCCRALKIVGFFNIIELRLSDM